MNYWDTSDCFVAMMLVEHCNNVIRQTRHDIRCSVFFDELRGRCLFRRPRDQKCLTRLKSDLS
ncbi:hypothetical protein BDR03DRAFT_970203 [Suillus americanus]|nr:hypothetical protein BDR03DRAFT_970203 [Suillus americanus]